MIRGIREHGGQRTTHRSLVMAGTTAAALLLAACGGSGGSDADPKDGASGGGKDKSIKYTECLRGEGLDVADSEPGAPVMTKGGDESKREAAFEKCKAYAPEQASDEKKGKRQDDSMKLAKCLRDNGAEGIKDPVDGVFNFPPGAAQDTPTFKKAMEACKQFMGKPQNGTP
ncbi:hypothetical protein [Streptomyces sp. H27-D2]|uniref:hypothetical protein n=1 Tax=Streptomyces sp. H27-D2 TaxID=3046304 RepID=UPI002DC032F1|nr:hypothetical protein [Streptomyces sp. H27-D2]MEC4017992.1 hypothetical protein [Streptomyces sp. H27-D2]